MTTDTDLGALIARVEGASEGSRELDARIWCIVSPAPETYTIDNWFRNDPRLALQDSLGLTLPDYLDRWPEDAAKTADSYAVPKFTASIDAAMSLVPKGRPFDLGCEDDGQSDWIADLTCFAPKGSDDHSLYVRGATPALALVAAALRARLAVGETGGAA